LYASATEVRKEEEEKRRNPHTKMSDITNTWACPKIIIIKPNKNAEVSKFVSWGDCLINFHSSDFWFNMILHKNYLE
jgi:hypothetical protein